MRMANAIQKIELPFPGMEFLLAEARAEGHDFIEILSKQWASGENRFDGPGEVLFGHLDQGLLVAVGGLTRDHYARSPEVSRIRRIYVRPGWRGKGIGRALVAALVEEARKGFHCVRLRAVNTHAARLYESLGFSPISHPDATHILHFFEPGTPS
jgi:GNAT superfamily N-acetyltransferase